MDELHKSSLSCHGNLKSTKILVDSYWICKVSDYGMDSMKYGIKAEDGDQRFTGELYFLTVGLIITLVLELLVSVIVSDRCIGFLGKFESELIFTFLNNSVNFNIEKMRFMFFGPT